MIMSHLSYRRLGQALEIGAGDGGQSETIAMFCDHLTCTELSETGNECVGKFRQRYLSNVTYMYCDATDLSGFADRSFDFVFSSNVLEHIPCYDACLVECKRVLKDDGLMIHVMPSRDWKVWNAVIRFIRFWKAPLIHGIDKTHLGEYISFGESPWVRRIESVGLYVHAKLQMPFYHGNGPVVIPLIILGNRLGLKSSTAYIIRKAPKSLL